MPVTEGAMMEGLQSLVQALPSPEALGQNGGQHQGGESQPKRNPLESQREKARATQKAHKVLDVLESKASKCLAALSSFEAPSSNASIEALEEEVASLQRSFDAVRRSVQSVSERKAKLKPKLDEIQCRLRKYTSRTTPAPSLGPLYYNARKFYAVIH